MSHDIFGGVDYCGELMKDPLIKGAIEKKLQAVYPLFRMKKVISALLSHIETLESEPTDYPTYIKGILYGVLPDYLEDITSKKDLYHKLEMIDHNIEAVLS